MSDNEFNDLNNSHKEENQEHTNRENNSDINEHLDKQNNNLNAKSIVQQQEEYRNIVNNTQQFDNMPHTNEEYIWRVGFGRRLGAYIIDNIFVYVLLIIAAILTGIFDDFLWMFGNAADLTTMMTNTDAINSISTRFVPLTLAVTFLYYSLEVIFAQSLGKMLLGIVIGTDDKQFASYGRLLVRFLIKHIGSIFSLLFFITSISFIDTLATIFSVVIFIGCFFVLSQRRQALHDMIAKTAVYFKDELLQFEKTDIKNIEIYDVE